MATSLEGRHEKQLTLIDLFSKGDAKRHFKFNECNYREHGQVKHYSTTVRLIFLNVVDQSINQSYVLKGNVQPFYVNQCMSLVNITQGRG